MSAAGIRIGVVASAMSENVREVPRLSRVCGFAGVQFDAYGAVDLTQLTASGRREFRHLVSAQEQEIVGLRVDLGGKGFAPGADVDRALDRVERAMEVAAGLGSPLVCVEAGPMPAPVRTETKPKVTQQQAGLILLPTVDIAPPGMLTEEKGAGRSFDSAAASHVDAAVVELGRRADRYSVRLAFRSELAGLPALERALAASRCPWFGVDFDPVAVHRDGWSVDEFFTRFGLLVQHVRGRDAVAGSEGRTKPTPVGRGSTHWDEVISALDQAGYTGWITLDPFELSNRVAAAEEGREHLEKIVR